MFYVTDLRDFKDIDLDREVSAAALALVSYLRRIVRAATVSSPSPHPTALACRRRPQRRRCPGHLRVERQEVPSYIEWGCPICSEGGRIDGWQDGHDDLSSLQRPPWAGKTRQVVVPEEAYSLLLEEESFDSRCARMVYAATASGGGVSLSGTEEELTALSDVVAAWTEDEPSPSRRRRWRQLSQSLDPRRRGWLDQRIDVMAGELDALGLVAPRAKLAAMIQKGLAEVAESLHISESSARRYLYDEQLQGLAREAAFQLAQEQPGADLHDLPRAIPISLQLLGRVVSALAEAARIRVLNDDELGAQGALELLSLFGQILHEVGPQSGPIRLPQAAVIRTGRLLEASAGVITAGGSVGPELPAEAGAALVGAFLADAGALRGLVSEHGTGLGPTTES